MGSLQKREQKGFVVKTKKLVQYKCVQFLLSYYFIILEGSDLSAAQHAVAVKRSYV